jgi:hypothetical protein
MSAAIADAGFSDNCSDAPVPGGGLLSVFADMSRLSGANVAQILREMADRIDQDGILIHIGQHPISKAAVDWWVSEKSSGEFQHDAYRKEGSRESDRNGADKE